VLEASMHFNVYFDDVTGQRLTAVAQQAGESRNALIRKAVSEWLARHAQPQWPEAVMDFQGIADMPPFEAERDRLKPPVEDPLA
jgi:predicted transcriptional regulator